MATKTRKAVPKPKQHGATLSDAVNKYIADEIDRNKFIAWKEGRQMALDFAVIALGRMGWRATKLREFEKTIGEVYVDYSELLSDVRKEDPDLWEAKAKIDREMMLYTGSENFASWDERHGVAN